MESKDHPILQEFKKTIIIDAPPSLVWELLTAPELMKQWMSETDISIVTDWKVGQSIVISGDWYKTGFENKGIVMGFEPERFLAYTHLSSLSRLPDIAENYSVFEFQLRPEEGKTALSVRLHDFPTETIYRHLAFYWNVAVELVRKLAEA
jgi:uncharacterized protein YndB with AHSA1/START domain